MRERERASGQIRTKCKNKYNILQSIYNEQYIEDQCGYLPVINEFSPLARPKEDGHGGGRFIEDERVHPAPAALY